MNSLKYERQLHGETTWAPVSESFVRSTLTAAHAIRDVVQKLKRMDEGGLVSTPIADYRKRAADETL